MFRFTKLIPKNNQSSLSSSLFKQIKYFSTNSNPVPPTPSSTIPDVYQKRQFITNLYGI